MTARPTPRRRSPYSVTTPQLPVSSSRLHMSAPLCVPPPEIHPAEIHEVRLQTLRVQKEIKFQRTKLNRFNARILQKTQGINRTIKQKTSDQTVTDWECEISQLQRSVASAEHSLATLRAAIEAATYDDATTVYQELDEEIRPTFLECERQRTSIAPARAGVQALESQLRAVSERASEGHVAELKRQIAHVKSVNATLGTKWRAYQAKMHNLEVELRVTEYRKANWHSTATIEAADRESEILKAAGEKLKEALENEAEEHKAKVKEIVDVIERQRALIVGHLKAGTDKGHKKSPVEQNTIE